MCACGWRFQSLLDADGGKEMGFVGRELGRGKGGSKFNGFGVGWLWWIEKFWIWGLLIEVVKSRKRWEEVWKIRFLFSRWLSGEWK